MQPTGQPHLLRKDFRLEAIGLSNQEWVPPQEPQEQQQERPEADGGPQLHGLGDEKKKEAE